MTDVMTLPHVLDADTAISQPVDASSPSPAVAAAIALLATLGDARRTDVMFAFDDDEQLVRWSNFPHVRRAGIRTGDLSQTQRDAVYAVLEATLSADGYQHALDIVASNEVLNQTPRRGPQGIGKVNYWFALLGSPSDSSPWRWMFGGHHLGLNATFANGDVTLAPSLTGAQPAFFTRNGFEVQVFRAENDAAFALINLLDASQQQKAIISPDFIDLLLGPGEDGKILQPEGIVATELSTEQQTALIALIRTRVGIINETTAAKRMAEIQTNLAQTYFAWYGPTTNGMAAYWRIQGPTVVIEYSPQPSGGSAINHIHAVYRDPTNDYGVKIAAGLPTR